MEFHVHMFYMTDLDMSDMYDRIDTVNRNFKDNGCPIQFHLSNTTRIPKEFIDYGNDQEGWDLAARLQSTYAVIAPNTVNVFCGELENANGWASLPQEGTVNSQVVYINTSVMSRLFNNIAETMTHEFGHWLGLPHTFDNDCYPGDYVIDTPPANPSDRDSGWSSWWIAGLSSEKTCGYSKDQIENFMDYTESASKFTPGQVYRMMIFAFQKLVGRMPRYENGIIV